MMQFLIYCWFIIVGLFIASIILERFIKKGYIIIIQLIVLSLLSILFGASIIYMLIVYVN